jgi:RimJ/RimL family protein N-acetyltransferase
MTEWWIIPNMDFEIPDIYPSAQTDCFETERATARRIEEDDLDPLRAIFEDPAWARGFGYEHPPNPQVFIDRAVFSWNLPAGQTDWTFAIIDRASQQVVGYTRVKIQDTNGDGWRAMPEIAITPAFRVHKYAYETMCGLVDWIFNDLKCPSGIKLEIRAECLQSNEGSLHLLGKLSDIGMKDQGEQPGIIKASKGEMKPTSVHVFTLTREGYRQAISRDRKK